MKKIQCNDCSRIREVEDDCTMAICLCGNTLNFNRNPVLSNDLTKDDQVLLKMAFSRGVASGKEPDASQILEEIGDTRIKVNLR